MSTLPQELADWIIDYLPGDPKGLSVGSLVSHAWLNSCRLHRFRKFVLAEYDKPLETWSIVAGLIRDLTVKNYPTFVEIAQCTQLERLELRNYSFPPGIPTSIEFFFPKLKELHLTRCFFSYPEDLTSFISGFPSLSSFLWKRFDVPDQDLLKYDAYTSVTSSAPLSTHLCIAEDPHTAHIDVLYLLSRSAQFKSIELHKWNSRPVSLNWVLRRCGPTLRELDIRSIQILASDASMRNATIDLSHNTNLHRLSIPYDTAPLDWVFRLLSTLRPHQIQDLTIAYLLWLDGDRFDWEQLDNFLLTPQFSALARLSIRVITMGGPHTPEMSGKELAKLVKLPRMRDRGILEVYHERKGRPSPFYPRFY